MIYGHISLSLQRYHLSNWVNACSKKKRMRLQPDNLRHFYQSSGACQVRRLVKLAEVRFDIINRPFFVRNCQTYRTLTDTGTLINE